MPQIQNLDKNKQLKEMFLALIQAVAKTLLNPTIRINHNLKHQIQLQFVLLVVSFCQVFQLFYSEKSSAPKYIKKKKKKEKNYTPTCLLLEILLQKNKFIVVKVIYNLQIRIIIENLHKPASKIRLKDCQILILILKIIKISRTEQLVTAERQPHPPIIKQYQHLKIKSANQVIKMSRILLKKIKNSLIKPKIAIKNINNQILYQILYMQHLKMVLV
ncbi:hypothetical protein TTHERM_000051689 (macronuclear) [Tetrahymena thermophila SB210]|uniref:Uncharacterized protein n=1 Tax=Tetrahymena thermophila (strain SB210) TaxID=312017 RepID=W7XDB8_TETTS|nr:hypothetical protein TTHERM_000051689 [Tetrahymena thermophila SB210]EWS74633.1 hypothetical protein TTHERM_000051689 [Tetrahymena thermophila SB210]|eukprot:XP_012652855.1 hypothetical protein TTHERM_000051689 [Tetrahymena thermophila SB210]